MAAKRPAAKRATPRRAPAALKKAKVTTAKAAKVKASAGGFNPGIRVTGKSGWNSIFANRELRLYKLAAKEEEDIIIGWRAEALALVKELKLARSTEAKERFKRQNAEAALSSERIRNELQRKTEQEQLESLNRELEASKQ
eukprot:TRINITY_DN79671_c0_g1_i1.p1 TRINITY_DN79671_c0_g1~~TRINITY_DN79671_c0_g1_i1.p1  ORF type:complete len:141 (-),score=45.64 TRINITY_DN79671_c0_g1_i1:121-543(-)